MSLSLDKCERDINYTVDMIECKYVPISRRLTELGFIKGARLKIIQFSALKKTLLIEIEDYVLSLRANVAALIKVIRK